MFFLTKKALANIEDSKNQSDIIDRLSELYLDLYKQLDNSCSYTELSKINNYSNKLSSVHRIKKCSIGPNISKDLDEFKKIYSKLSRSESEFRKLSNLAKKHAELEKKINSINEKVYFLKGQLKKEVKKELIDIEKELMKMNYNKNSSVYDCIEDNHLSDLSRKIISIE